MSNAIWSFDINYDEKNSFTVTLKLDDRVFSTYKSQNIDNESNKLRCLRWLYELAMIPDDATGMENAVNLSSYKQLALLVCDVTKAIFTQDNV